jgi:FkbM family methyltransferase
VLAASRLRRAWWGVRHESSWAWRHVVCGRAAFLRNIVAYRIIGLAGRVPFHGREYELTTDTGVVIRYRRERGDLQGIREIFMDEIYRLPDGAAPSSLLDLGAHIGLATLWLSHEYQLSQVAAYEPVPANFDLLTRNCARNGVDAHLHQAAVSRYSSSGGFTLGESSNLGRLAEGDSGVAVVGIRDVVSSISFGPSLVKIDIEGAERQILMDEDATWLPAFEFVMIEMHPHAVSIDDLVHLIEGLGFAYFPPTEWTTHVQRAKRERLFVRRPTSLTR